MNDWLRKSLEVLSARQLSLISAELTHEGIKINCHRARASVGRLSLASSCKIATAAAIARATLINKKRRESAACKYF